MKEKELDMLINELDRGVTEREFVYRKELTHILKPDSTVMVRFKTTAGRRTSQIVNELKHKEGLVVFVDDNFINHQSLQMQF